MYLTLPDVYCPRLMTMDRDGNENLKGRRHPRRDLETGGTQPKVDFEWQSGT